MENNGRLARKTAIGMDEMVRLYIKSMGIAPQMNSHRVFQAWCEASGASSYTSRYYFSEGRLTVTISSSVARSRLMFQKDVLVDKINAILKQDELYSMDIKGASYVKELILK